MTPDGISVIEIDNLKHLHIITLEGYIYFRKATFSLYPDQSTLCTVIAIFLLILFLYLPLYSMKLMDLFRLLR